MHIHILGICGTFMGSLALLARDLGHTVTGSDANVYPPMSTQLENAGVEIMQGYAASHLQPAPDLVIVGNAMKRGIEAVEYMLNERIPYTSGPQFFGRAGIAIPSCISRRRHPWQNYHYHDAGVDFTLCRH